MLQLKNATPFKAAFFVFPDAEGVDTVFVAVKATFSFGLGGVTLAPEQCPLVLADEYWGEPARSGVRYAAEAHICKSATDVVLVGAAYAPGGRAVPRFDARLRVGRLQKTVRVLGDRTWRRAGVGLAPSSPAPALKVPLLWENAFGGRDETIVGPESVEARNPIGRGFRGRRRAEEALGKPLPNVEDPRAPLGSWGERPTPTGLGFVAPSWAPRLGYAGTYDDAWVTSRAPYLPKDFDVRHLNAVAADQVYAGFLQGGEPVELANLSPRGPERFVLPMVQPQATVRIDGEAHRPSLALETLLFEPEEARFCMTWRGAVPCDKKALKVEVVEIEVQRLRGASS